MVRTKPLAVIAFGGNALVPDSDHLSVHDQFPVIEEICATVAEIVQSGWNVVVTHGNGPQVGVVMRRVEMTRDEVVPVSLDYAVSYTQGTIGCMFSLALAGAFRKRNMPDRALAMISHTVVSRDDSAFSHPTKPIGSWYSEEQARALSKDNGWTIVEDSGRGWRRTVPSPRPVGIVQLEAIRTLLAQDFTVVTLGGGGIPVVGDGEGYAGVEAVIDKDFASSLLARQLDADMLIFPTAVPQVAIRFNQPRQQWLDTLSLEEARRYLAEGEFPPGSMAPKIAALMEFVEASGKPGVITDLQHLRAAMSGSAGTRLIPDKPVSPIGE